MNALQNGNCIEIGTVVHHPFDGRRKSTFFRTLQAPQLLCSGWFWKTISNKQIPLEHITFPLPPLECRQAKTYACPFERHTKAILDMNSVKLTNPVVYKRIASETMCDLRQWMGKVPKKIYIWKQEVDEEEFHGEICFATHHAEWVREPQQIKPSKCVIKSFSDFAGITFLACCL